MSLILDALSRSERERRAEAQAVPDLLVAQTVVPLRRRWPWLLAIVAVLAGVVFAAAFFVHRGAPPAETAQPRELPVSSVQHDRSAVASSAAAPVTENPAVGESSSGTGEPRAPAARAALPETAPADAEAVAQLYKAQRAESVEQGSRETEAPAALSVPAAEPPGTAPIKDTPIDLAAALRQAQESVADASIAPNATPLLSQRSKQYRDRVPTLTYLRHDYATGTRAGDSSVTINGVSLRAGQRSGPVQVVEILPDSVILRFDGEDFRLRALNSWINL